VVLDLYGKYVLIYTDCVQAGFTGLIHFNYLREGKHEREQKVAGAFEHAPG
jgi:hypothetical protein